MVLVLVVVVVMVMVVMVVVGAAAAVAAVVVVWWQRKASINNIAIQSEPTAGSVQGTPVALAASSGFLPPTKRQR